MLQHDFLAAGDGLGDGTDHQAGRVGPRLGGVEDDAAEQDAGLFPHFAADGFLGAFGRFDEAGEGGVPAWRPALLAPDQDAARVGGDDGHDDGGIRAREREVRDAVSGGAGRAIGLMGGGNGGADGAAEGGKVFGRARPFHAAVDG